MRIVSRQELMALPNGTLFCELIQPFTFGMPSIKGNTIAWAGSNKDFFELGLCWG